MRVLVLRLLIFALHIYVSATGSTIDLARQSVGA